MSEKQIVSGKKAVDQYYLTARANLISLAADIDRLYRLGGEDAAADYRVRALVDAAKVLADGEPDRAARVLKRLSDPTDALTDGPVIPRAVGAWNPEFAEKEK